MADSERPVAAVGEVGLGRGPGELYATLVGVEGTSDGRIAVHALEGVIQRTTTKDAILAEPNPNRRLAIA